MGATEREADDPAPKWGLDLLAQFKKIPDRDAYATIRGYVYQAVLTVQAWVALAHGEQLELEAGEDIDWQRLAQSDDPHLEVERIVGQVKFRSNGISLRSEISLSSLTDYFIHRNANPNIRIKFRFISNAKLARERGYPHPEGLSGIAVWNRLHSSGDAGTCAGDLALLREILIAPSEPASVDRENLGHLRSFVRECSDNDFLEFVHDFTWMASSADLDTALRDAEKAISLRPELLHFGRAAPLCLQSLLHHVLIVLSQPSDKILRPEDCAEILLASQHSATEAVAEGLESVRSSVAQSSELLMAQVKVLESKVEQFGVDPEMARVRFANATQGMAEIHAYLEPPDIVMPSAPRTQLRQRVESEMGHKGVAALVGEVGCGKSQLALAVKPSGATVTWLSLRANEGADAKQLLELATRKCLQNAAGTRMLVVDDLEKAISSAGFLDRLVATIRLCKEQAIQLLLCSTQRFPVALQQRTVSVLVGGYTDEDIASLLLAHQAPEAINSEKFRATIAALTNSHPLLVGALLSFLIEKDWKLNADDLDALLSRSFANDIQVDIQRRLLEQESEGAKELLYRISLSERPINRKQVMELGSIEKEIPRPNEEFVRLLDTWLQRLGEGKVLASPLVKNIGKDNLSALTSRAVHDRLASWILAKEPLDQSDATFAMHHLFAADKPREAGWILLQALQAMLPVAREISDALLAQFWQNAPLPPGIGTELGMMIRGYQCAMLGLRGENLQYVLDDLIAMSDQAAGTFHDFTAFGAFSTIAIQLAQAQPDTALRTAILALKFESRVPEESRAELQTLSGIVGTLWMIGAGCRSQATIRNWLIAIEGLSPTQLKVLRSSNIAELSAWMIFQRFWLDENLRSAKERNWSQVAKFLDASAQSAGALGLTVLTASARRVQLMISIAHFGETDAADAAATKYISAFAPHGTEEFLIAEGCALTFMDRGEWPLALRWLLRAAASQANELVGLYVHNDLHLGEALFRSGQDPSHVFDRAIRLAENSSSLGEIDVIICLTEKAVWQWLTKDEHASLQTWDRALDLLFSNDHVDKRWKTLFVIMGNHTSVFSSAFETETTAKKVTMPFLGLTLKDVALDGLYSEGAAWYVAATMVQFADRLNHEELAAKWALRANEIAEKFGSDPKSRSVLRVAVPSFLRERDYDSAVNLARESTLCVTLRPHFKLSPEMRALHPELQRVEETWQPIDPEAAEFSALLLSLVPALLQIAALSIDNEQEAYRLLASLLEKARQVAEANKSKTWQSASKTLEDIASGKVAWSAEFGPSDGDAAPNKEAADKTRQLLLAFGGGFALRQSPKDVLIQQASWISYIRSYLRGSPVLQSFFADLLLIFWRAVLDGNGYYFSRPGLVREELISSVSQSSAEAVLVAVCRGLSLRPPDWLIQAVNS